MMHARFKPTVYATDTIRSEDYVIPMLDEIDNDVAQTNLGMNVIRILFHLLILIVKMCYRVVQSLLYHAFHLCVGNLFVRIILQGFSFILIIALFYYLWCFIAPYLPEEMDKTLTRSKPDLRIIQDKLNPRSYIVETPHGSYRRNREFLKPSRLSFQRSEHKKPEPEELPIIKSPHRQVFNTPEKRHSPVQRCSPLKETEITTEESEPFKCQLSPKT